MDNGDHPHFTVDVPQAQKFYVQPCNKYYGKVQIQLTKGLLNDKVFALNTKFYSHLVNQNTIVKEFTKNIIKGNSFFLTFKIMEPN
jgi:hypothetical protein